jgi:hypothetical protein
MSITIRDEKGRESKNFGKYNYQSVKSEKTASF